MTIAASGPSRAEILSLFRSLLRTARDFSDYNIREAEILSLFRSLLRTARDFSDYNIREYAKRRTIDGFRQNRNLSDPSSISSAFSEGKSELQVAKRQAVVYSLYAPKAKSVMEMESH
ncbi:Complex 1 LYR protein [Macleaya cordata]|uniref:Complex 1 LYR protein n=1 Tax=Macleaya cordata TaxID=56857 RepID=A0A200PRD6_MACCD|nr:Complex 1 LYR protein [Macleaya cordata]